MAAGLDGVTYRDIRRLEGPLLCRLRYHTSSVYDLTMGLLAGSHEGASTHIAESALVSVLSHPHHNAPELDSGVVATAIAAVQQHANGEPACASVAASQLLRDSLRMIRIWYRCGHKCLAESPSRAFKRARGAVSCSCELAARAAIDELLANE